MRVSYGYVPLRLVGQSPHHSGIREYTEAEKKILEIAEKRFRLVKKGLKSSHLVDIGFAKNDADARSKIKRCVAKKILFTFGHKRPQEYYPITLEAQVMSHLLCENVPIDPSGLNPEVEELRREVRAQTLIDFVLPMLPDIPLGMHNFHFYFKTDLECYAEVRLVASSGNRGKSSQQRIDGKTVTCTIYPKGTVDIQVRCNNEPFILNSLIDVSHLVAFFGEVKGFVSSVLCDTRGSFVPPVLDWVMSECDINKDVNVSHVFHLASLHIEGKLRVKDIEYILRIYFKVRGPDTLLRIEAGIAPNMRIGQILAGLFGLQGYFLGN